MSLADAVQLYGEALRSGEPLHWVTVDGRSMPLDVPTWLADADAVDRAVLDRCPGPVLDVGCGPGRILAELNARGVAAAGVDVSADAVALARQNGGTALCRDVFLPMPAEGTWSSVVLFDGNIGIGGDPLRLLFRMGELLAPGGAVVVETHPHPRVDRRLDVWLALGARRSTEHIPWAVVGEEAVRRDAAVAGFEVEAVWGVGGRSFVRLVKPAAVLAVAA